MLTKTSMSHNNLIQFITKFTDIAHIQTINNIYNLQTGESL